MFGALDRGRVCGQPKVYTVLSLIQQTTNDLAGVYTSQILDGGRCRRSLNTGFRCVCDSARFLPD